MLHADGRIGRQKGRVQELDPERPLNPEEILQLFAEYQIDGDVDRAAQSIQCSLDNALRVIAIQAEKSPEILDDRRLLLWMGLTARQISVMALKRAAATISESQPHWALKTALLAKQGEEKYLKAYKADREVTGDDMDADQLQEAIEKEKQRIADLRGNKSSPEPDAEADADATGVGGEASLEKDAGSR